jgi:hypothetical protein
VKASANQGDDVMKARFARSAALTSRARPASTVGLFLSLFATGSAHALGTPEQRKAGTGDVYRLYPNARAITACLRQQKASLSEACRTVFEQ